MIRSAQDDTPIPAFAPMLVGDLLASQQELSAVEQFSRRHDEGNLPAQAKHYRDLIPLSKPGEGEQYAFEVDLDSCTGCKACVTACHNLNGLDPTEAWRDVGLLQGGPVELPVLQHVTTACHHCLEPACMTGCPVKAYEKDPATGIVRHLDDQCIGCQYCILMCPYDVPKYNKNLGIVRKCDMCHDRLAVEEAPACVQACPNQAIRIRLVEKQRVVEDCESGQFLPGAPDPGYTLPTTTYKTNRIFPRNMLPASYHASSPEHAHLPLVFMLVLTQMSVGAFLVQVLLGAMIPADRMASVRPLHVTVAGALGLLALAVSTLHLGRPLYAFRAILGFRTSWLSREIVAFGLFANAAVAYGASYWLLPDLHGLHERLGLPVALLGLVGVFCSVMVYHATQRVFWHAASTGPRFFLSTMVLGIPTALATSLVAAGWLEGLSLEGVMAGWGRILCTWLIGLAGLKLVLESSVFAHLHDRRQTPLKRTAMMMKGELAGVTLKRFAFGALGGLLIPAALLVATSPGAGTPDGLFVGGLSVLMVGLCLMGEMLERYLFFTAVVSSKMPGGLM